MIITSEYDSLITLNNQFLTISILIKKNQFISNIGRSTKKIFKIIFNGFSYNR